MSLDFIMSVMKEKAAAAAQHQSLEDETLRSSSIDQVDVSEVQVMSYSTACGNDRSTSSRAETETGSEVRNDFLQQWNPIISDVISVNGIEDVTPGNSESEDDGAVQSHVIGSESPAGKDRKRFPCEICHRTFRIRRFLVEHVATHTNDKQHCCPVCRRRFTRQHHLKHHVTMKHGLDLLASLHLVFPCDFCDCHFSDPENLRIHRLQHTSIKLYDCPKCGETLTNPFAIQQHARIHKSSLQHECKKCGKRYAQKVTLKMHMLIHENEKLGLYCVHCNQHFYHRSALVRHLRCLHPECEIFNCKLCGLKFQLQSELDDHLLLHSEKKTHMCQHCSRIFATASALATHTHLHSADKPYHCPECDKKFRTTNSLRQHVANQHGEKLFKCSLCDKRFHAAGRLALHSTWHQTERPYVCELCNRTFKAESHLKQHLSAFHSDSKPFICQLCHKDFALLSHLRGHHRTQHYVKTKCHLCDKMYIYDSNLRAHMKTHHGSQVADPNKLI